MQYLSHPRAGMGRTSKDQAEAGRVNIQNLQQACAVTLGDGICPVCHGMKRVAQHCKVFCGECGALLENCCGD